MGASEQVHLCFDPQYWLWLSLCFSMTTFDPLQKYTAYLHTAKTQV